MNHELSVAVLSGVGGMIGWGLADFLAKRTIDEIGDIQTLFWGQFFGIAPLLLLVTVNRSEVEFGPWDLLFIPVMGAWSGLSYIPTYVAFGKGKVSLLSPIFASYAIVVTLLSALIFNESIPVSRAIAIGIVFLGILLISGNPRDLVALPKGGPLSGSDAIQGLPEILVAVFLYSIWLIALDQLLDGRQWLPLLLAIRSISAFSLFAYARTTQRRLSIEDASLWKYLILVGIFDVLAFGCVSYGFNSSSHVSVVAMLSSAFSLPTIVLARLVLKEKSTVFQAAGSLMVILGIVLVSIL